MAIWRLAESHYLCVPEHYWEHKETDRETGRQKVRKVPVPTHLNPKDPCDWTHKSGLDVTRGGDSYAEGEIIVAWAQGYEYIRDGDGMVFRAEAPVVNLEGKVDRRILIFEGPPTPGMEPIDDEAKEIMTHFKWDDPLKDKYFGMTYAERLVFDSVTKPDKSAEVLTETLALMREMMAQNQALLVQLANPPREVPARRV